MSTCTYLRYRGWTIVDVMHSTAQYFTLVDVVGNGSMNEHGFVRKARIAEKKRNDFHSQSQTQSGSQSQSPTPHEYHTKYNTH